MSFRFSFLLFFLSFIQSLSAQRTDPWLERLLRANGAPELQAVLDRPDSFQYQVIYTKIDRDRKNRPKFTHYYLNVDRQRYFNPASTVKLPAALAALEKLRQLDRKDVNLHTAMFIDSVRPGQRAVASDTSSATGFPSVAHYIKKIFLVSDNDAYNRLYEFAGQDYLNRTLHQKGYKEVRLTRRFLSIAPDENRHTPPVRFMEGNRIVYSQPALYSHFPFDLSRKILVGRAHYDRRDSLVPAPMDFTEHNHLPLEDLQQILQSVLFPRSVPKAKRFRLQDEDYRLLYRYMSAYPSVSRFPNYDTTEFFDSYTKFFFKSGRSRIPKNLRIFNKTGWSYGFLTDAAYVADFEHGIEFMLSAVIYANSDGVLNDNKYEYVSIGYPFFRDLYAVIYDYERKRPRAYKPDLSRFRSIIGRSE